MAESKEYMVVEGSADIITRLTERYPDIYWAVKPSEVVVLGITNKERPKSRRELAQIKRVTGATLALLEANNVQAKYIVELYYSDWNELDSVAKQWLIHNMLLHIPGPDESGLIKADVHDFAVTLDIIGVDWLNRANLPSLLDGSPVQFNKSLATRLHLKENAEEEVGV